MTGNESDSGQYSEGLMARHGKGVANWGSQTNQVYQFPKFLNRKCLLQNLHVTSYDKLTPN